jgi:gamma-glutamyltranspeptidase/glutathione hydrolase
MAPTMVFDRQGRLVLTLGSPGGEWIINYVARALVGVLDWRLDLQQAFALAHVGSRNGPTELERGTAAEQLQPSLELLGHRVRVIDMTSGLHGVQRTAEGWLGAADPRREGAARGD